MKKYLIVFIFCFTAGITFAQDNTNLSFLNIYAGGGLTGGAAGISKKSAFPSNYELIEGIQPNYNLGVGIKYNFAWKFYLDASLAYVSRGFSYSVNYPSGMGSVDYDISAKYIQIPLLIQFGKDLYISAGGYLAFLASPMKLEKNTMPANTIDHSEISSNNRKSVDYGLVFGLGCKLFGPIELGIKTQIGLVEVIHDPALSFKTFSLELLLSYRLNLFN